MKIASDFRGKCKGEFIFPTSNLMFRKLLDILIIGQLVVRILFVLSESVENYTLLKIFAVLSFILKFEMLV